jgi:hypothetical protein
MIEWTGCICLWCCSRYPEAGEERARVIARGRIPKPTTYKSLDEAR